MYQHGHKRWFIQRCGRSCTWIHIQIQQSRNCRHSIPQTIHRHQLDEEEIPHLDKHRSIRRFHSTNHKDIQHEGEREFVASHKKTNAHPSKYRHHMPSRTRKNNTRGGDRSNTSQRRRDALWSFESLSKSIQNSFPQSQWKEHQNRHKSGCGNGKTTVDNATPTPLHTNRKYPKTKITHHVSKCEVTPKTLSRHQTQQRIQSADVLLFCETWLSDIGPSSDDWALDNFTYPTRSQGWNSHRGLITYSKYRTHRTHKLVHEDFEIMHMQFVSQRYPYSIVLSYMPSSSWDLTKFFEAIQQILTVEKDNQ